MGCSRDVLIVAAMKYLLGDLLIDTGRQSVSRSGAVIALPKLSYDLLLVLIRAAPDLVSLDELMRQVWPGVVVSPETVSKRVMLLRDALDEDPRAPRYIAVLRGRGYQIVADVSEAAEAPAVPPATRQTPVGVADPEPVEAEGANEAGEAVTTSPATPAQMGTAAGQLTPRRFLIPAIVVSLLVVGVGSVAYWKWQKAPAAPAVSTFSGEPSIAVLPLTDMSEKKDQEYFADGMSEEILDLLVKIPGLKVIGRTSSFQFKGQNADLRTIGEKLGATYLVEGSVRKSGDRLRVTAQLIDSRDGSHLMAETYDRKIEDVLKMQDEIAAALVRALQLTVGVDRDLPRPTLPNPEAYSLYLHGRQAYDRLDRQGFEQAASDFQRALALDPSLGSAAAALALMYEGLGEFGFIPPAMAFEQARHEAQHALALDPHIALAHAVLGSVHDVYDWDWPAADRETQQALALAPNDAGILHFAGRRSLTIGRWDEALNSVNASLALDPLLPPTYIELNWVQVRRGRLAEAEAAARRAMEISPTYVWAHYYLGVTLLVAGNPEAAMAVFAKEIDTGARLGGLAMGNWALLRTPESDRSLAQMLKDKDQTGGNAFGIAEVYAYRGEADSALYWLERAYQQKDVSLYLVKGDPPLKSLETNPRYKAFLRKMNLPE